VQKLQWKPGQTEWGDYYAATNYEDSAAAHKKSLVTQYLTLAKRSSNRAIDLGANNGLFSRLAMEQGYNTVAVDVDEVAVELNYRAARKAGEQTILPLVQDLTNPSPALGWAHAERMSLTQRGPADTVMALALIHHLAISNNVPLERCAEFFASVGQQLIIEFVPKDDSQVKRLLATRADIFTHYTQQGFESAFSEHFRIEESQQVESSSRVLYLMSVR
jgi:ribosomal protein L11 methylase PrmA